MTDTKATVLLAGACLLAGLLLGSLAMRSCSPVPLPASSTVDTLWRHHADTVRATITIRETRVAPYAVRVPDSSAVRAADSLAALCSALVRAAEGIDELVAESTYDTLDYTLSQTYFYGDQRFMHSVKIKRVDTIQVVVPEPPATLWEKIRNYGIAVLAGATAALLIGR